MRILVTGATGFVGQHLWQLLRQEHPDAELLGTAFGTNCPPAHISIDLRDASRTYDLVAQFRPDVIYHLAGQAFVPHSFQAPWETLATNVQPQVNLFEACRALELRPRILVIGSAEVYGRILPHDIPIAEAAHLQPSNPYSVSKATQDMLAYQYFASYAMDIIRLRPFNHIGPGQSEHFAASSFAMQLARIEAKQQEAVIKVGNLSAERDFTDVRDVVRAYTLVAKHGKAGEVYNVASGQARSIRALLNTLLQHSKVTVEIRTETSRLRPVDVPLIIGDCRRLHEATGWRPEVSFEQSLLDILNDCRQRVLNH